MRRLFRRLKDWWRSEEVSQALAGTPEYAIIKDDYALAEMAWEAGRTSMLLDLRRPEPYCSCACGRDIEERLRLASEGVVIPDDRD